jgi:hypothetical protein
VTLSKAEVARDRALADPYGYSAAARIMALPSPETPGNDRLYNQMVQNSTPVSQLLQDHDVHKFFSRCARCIEIERERYNAQIDMPVTRRPLMRPQAA